MNDPFARLEGILEQLATYTMPELLFNMELDPSIVGMVLFKTFTPDQKLLALSTLYCCSTAEVTSS